MRAHGDYNLVLKGNIIHVYPTGGFNAEGVEALHRDISDLMPENESWALFEHPKDLAGLTPDAIEMLILYYKKLSQLNCCAVALEISPTWRGIFERLIVKHLEIEVFLDGDNNLLEQALITAITKHNFS